MLQRCRAKRFWFPWLIWETVSTDCDDIEACEPFEDMPKLPTARVMWKTLPSLGNIAEAGSWQAAHTNSDELWLDESI